MGVGVAWDLRRQLLGIAGPDLPLTCLLTSSFAEQLVLYLKVAELLSSGLQTAIDQIRAGKLCLSSTVKQGEDVGSGMWCCGKSEQASLRGDAGPPGWAWPLAQNIE